MISHHGKGRPLVPPVPDGAAEVVYAEVEGASVKVKADLAIVDWTQPGRFRQLNDPWDGKTSCGPPILMMQAS